MTTEKKQGRSVSTFRYPDDDRLILHLIGEMAAKGIRASDSQIVRAGLRALDQLPLKDAIALVTAASESDKRRGCIPIEKRHKRKVTDRLRSKIIERDQKCKICGDNERLVVDHILAISNGGCNSEQNLQALCFSCNQKKAQRCFRRTFRMTHAIHRADVHSFVLPNLRIMSDTPETDAAERSEPTALSGLATSACPLPEIVQTAFVFAARYVHHRDTGGTLAVCKALAYVWPDLSEQTRSQILRESYEATTNIREWERFRGNEEANVQDDSRDKSR